MLFVARSAFGARYFTEMLERVLIRAADRLVKQLFNVLFGCDAAEVAQELVKVTHQNPRCSSFSLPPDESKPWQWAKVTWKLRGDDRGFRFLA